MIVLSEQRLLNTLRLLTNSSKQLVDSGIHLDNTIYRAKLLTNLATIEALLDVVQVNDEEVSPINNDEFQAWLTNEEEVLRGFPGEAGNDEEYLEQQDSEDFINDEELMAATCPSTDVIFTGEYTDLGEPLVSVKGEEPIPINKVPGEYLPF